MFNNECSLREVLDSIDNKKIFIADGLNSKDELLAKEVIDIFKDQVNSAICFDIGEAKNLIEIKPIYELIKLPYDKCWFNFHRFVNEKKIKYGVYAKNEDDFIYLTIFVYHFIFNEWVFSGVLRKIKLEEKNIVWGSVLTIDKDTNGIAIFAAAIISRFLSALNCINTKKVLVSPPESIQKQRAKRGKKPLFSYYTLHVDLPKTQSNSNDLGGTHSSPRVHLRRGHPRQYSQGKWTWVQPHVVGSKENGMIHKDYAFNY
jgi:hypothetical protein